MRHESQAVSLTQSAQTRLFALVCTYPDGWNCMTIHCVDLSSVVLFQFRTTHLCGRAVIKTVNPLMYLRVFFLIRCFVRFCRCYFDLEFDGSIVEISNAFAFAHDDFCMKPLPNIQWNVTQNIFLQRPNETKKRERCAHRDYKLFIQCVIDANDIICVSYLCAVDRSFFYQSTPWHFFNAITCFMICFIPNANENCRWKMNTLHVQCKRRINTPQPMQQTDMTTAT